MRCRLGLALVLLVPTALVGGGPRATRAAGTATGRIVFMSNRGGDFDLYAVNPDGTGLTQLTHSDDVDVDSPVPSPDGRLIAAGGFAVMNADGSNQRPLPGCSSSAPSWSPDSTRLACAARGGEGIAIVDPASRKVTSLTSVGSAPAWSPDGRTIAFSDKGLWVIPAAGGAKRRLGRRELGFDRGPS
jgi:Tol biopolymer transport system component